MRRVGALLPFCGLNKVARLLRCHAIPDAVARRNDKVELRVDLVGADLGEATNRHHLWLKGRRLVLPIADGATDRNDAVDATVFNHVTCLQNTRTLRWKIWLVVLGEVDSLAVLTDHTAGIASVADHDVSRRYKYYIGSAARLDGVVLPGHVARVLPAESFKLLAPVWTQKHLVDLHEHRGQGLLIVSRLKGRIILDLLNEMIPTKLGDLGATMPVKDSEKRVIGYEVHSRDVSILVGLAPALHT